MFCSLLNCYLCASLWLDVALTSIFVSLQDRSIAVWDMQSPTEIKLRRVLVGHRAAVNVVDFDEKYIVSASGDRTIKVWLVFFTWTVFCLFFGGGGGGGDHNLAARKSKCFYIQRLGVQKWRLDKKAERVPVSLIFFRYVPGPGFYHMYALLPLGMQFV